MTLSGFVYYAASELNQTPVIVDVNQKKTEKQRDSRVDRINKPGIDTTVQSGTDNVAFFDNQFLALSQFLMVLIAQ